MVQRTNKLLLSICFNQNAYMLSLHKEIAGEPFKSGHKYMGNYIRSCLYRE